MSSIPQSLIAAYRQAIYRVEGRDGAFTLELDRRSEPLARLLAAGGHDCAVFMTAHNPASTPRTACTNRAAQAQLCAALAGVTGTMFAGKAADRTGRWPDEDSALGLGVDLDAARRLGQAFGQNAVVWAGADAVPRLILLR